MEYRCIKCQAIVKTEDMTLEFKCSKCGYKILKKIRPPITRHVKAI